MCGFIFITSSSCSHGSCKLKSIIPFGSLYRDFINRLMKEKEFLFVFLDFYVKEKINQLKMQRVLNKLRIFIEDRKKSKTPMQIIKQMMKTICINYYTYVLFFVYFFCSMLNNKNTGIPSKYNVRNRSKQMISRPTSSIELFMLKVTLSALEVVKDCSAAAVAQSVERQSHNLKVVSSILTRGIYFSKNYLF